MVYKLWFARGFRGGWPEEDLLRVVCADSINSLITNPRSQQLQGPRRKRGTQALRNSGIGRLSA